LHYNEQGVVQQSATIADMAKPDVLSQKIIQLLEKHHLLTVQGILQQLIQDGTTYNKTSVYRSLEKLLAAKTVCRHDFTGGEASYELHDAHHDHVVCTTCGSVAAVTCRIGHEVRIPGYSIDHHHVTFFGVCKSCKLTQ
jgi:Fe2+ or Zn2+ uptake regulation protein